ncbi:MAG TPA: tetratricopeptide repeat protein [Bryobacteraceae bacterium]|jgi:tetratricopeptide (TPR) repeat protein|nr:tetratricopeptide repeat protein [Bryobacteraceae bacterium]
MRRALRSKAELAVIALGLLGGLPGMAAECTPSGLSAQETLRKFQALDREAQTAMERGQFAEAAARYREATCLQPKASRAFYGLGIAEAAAQNFPAARKALETASTLLPDNPLPLAMLVRVNVAAGDPEGTKKALRTTAARFPRDGELHATLARFLAENKLLDLALAESLRAEQSGATNPEASIALAVLENTVGAYEDAVRHAAALESQPGLPDAVKASAAGVAGLSYESMGEREAAIEHLKLAIRLDPGQENSYLALAYLYEKAQRFPEAVEVLTAARSKLADSRHVLLPLGNNLVWAEQFAAGVEVLKELLRVEPGASEGYVRLAEAYRKMGRPELETEALRDLERRHPEYPMIHVLIAQAMMTADPVDYPKVLAELALAEKTTPSDPDLFYLRGKVYLATNRQPEAVAALKRAIALRPMEPSPYYQLGMAYRKSGKPELAREILQRMEHVKAGRTAP